MDAEVYEILSSYKEALDVVLAKIDQLEKEKATIADSLQNLQSLVVDQLLNPIKADIAASEKADRFEDFSDEYGERLNGYDSKLGKLEGKDDYSFAQDVFNQYDDLPEPKPEMADFVEQAVTAADDKINSIKKIFGIAPDEKIEIVSEGDDMKVKADGETVAAVKDGEVVEGNVEQTEPEAEAPAESKDPELDFGEDEEKEDDPEEVAKYEEELRKALS